MITTKMKRSTFLVSMSLLLVLLGGCAADEESKGIAFDNGGGSEPGNNGIGNGANNGGANNGFVPEREEEFDFSRPAVVGDKVFVANETLNAVAVIESDSLRIRTVPVGFRPTRVVGPSLEVDAPSVMVLNEGSSTVTFIESETLDTRSVRVMRRANAIDANPTGTHGVVWFDDEDVEPGEPTGDLSAVTVVSGEEAYEIAVGFHVRRVEFTRDGSQALVLTDDGLSVLDLESIDGDALAPPTPVLPRDLQNDTALDDEVIVGPDGEYALTRTTEFEGVVLLDIATGETYEVPLGEAPTDIDWVATATPRVLITLRQSDRAAVATVPDGLVAASEEFDIPPVPPLNPDMGTGDAGNDAGNDAGSMEMGTSDMGTSDTGTSDMGMSDLGTADLGADTGSLDAALSDGGVDAGSDTGFDATNDTGNDDVGVDMASDDPVDFPAVEGFDVVDVLFEDLGAASIAKNGVTALLYSTVGGEKRAVLLDLEDLTQRGLSFEKGVRGATSDADGDTFVVFHTKEEGAVPPGTTPADPEFIARRWGLSVVDVATGTGRLVLTEQKPGMSALWSGDGTDPKLYVTFEGPGPGQQALPSHRDLLWINLRTFRQDTLRLPSLPAGLGPIGSAEKIFVSQKHPQGRLTFVDVVTGNWQTVTGYQLNAGID